MHSIIANYSCSCKVLLGIMFTVCSFMLFAIS